MHADKLTRIAVGWCGASSGMEHIYAWKHYAAPMRSIETNSNLERHGGYLRCHVDPSSCL
jgi:hypothetical protein